MDNGDLVPDELVIAMILDKVEEEGDDGFLLDGFPRTAGQADALTEELEKLGRRLTAALSDRRSDEVVLQRLSGRRQCSNGHLYHVEFDPPKHDDVCDQDGKPLFRRKDDEPETVKKRLDDVPQADRAAEGLLRGAWSAASLRRDAGQDGGPRPHPRDACDAAARGTAVIIKKSPAEIDQMAAAGEILVRTMDLLAGKIRPGVTTKELDAAAEKFIRSQGATPAFKGYRGFPGSICASPNDMVVHGIPGASSSPAATSCASTSASSRTAGSPTPPAPSRSATSRRSRRSCSR